MFCFRFAISLLSSTFLSTTLSLATVQCRPIMGIEPIQQQSQNLSDWTLLPDIPTLSLSFSLRLKKSPAPLEADGFEDSPLNQGIPVAGTAVSSALPAQGEYSYVYETEEFAELPEGFDWVTDVEDSENADQSENTAVTETPSVTIRKSSVVNGVLGLLEESTAELSVLFRNISLQISHLRETF